MNERRGPESIEAQERIAEVRTLEDLWRLVEELRIEKRTRRSRNPQEMWRVLNSLWQFTEELDRRLSQRRVGYEKLAAAAKLMNESVTSDQKRAEAARFYKAGDVVHASEASTMADYLKMLEEKQVEFNEADYQVVLELARKAEKLNDQILGALMVIERDPMAQAYLIANGYREEKGPSRT